MLSTQVANDPDAALNENSTLAKYDAACRALAEAVTADEVITIRDEARALEALARVAGNLDIEIYGRKLRTRAEVRLGEKLIEGQRKGTLASHGRPSDKGARFAPEPCPGLTLKDIGVKKKLRPGPAGSAISDKKPSRRCWSASSVRAATAAAWRSMCWRRKNATRCSNGAATLNRNSPTRRRCLPAADSLQTSTPIPRRASCQVSAAGQSNVTTRR